MINLIAIKCFKISNPKNFIIIELNNGNLTDVIDFAAVNGYRLWKQVKFNL